MSSAIKDLGLRVKRVRDWLDLSQDDLSDQLGVRQATVSSWERGLHRPARGYVRQLADLTGNPPLFYRYLVEGDGFPKEDGGSPTRGAKGVPKEGHDVAVKALRDAQRAAETLAYNLSVALAALEGDKH